MYQYKQNRSNFCSLLILVFSVNVISISAYAQSNSKVVVIPLAADSIDANLIPVAIGSYSRLSGGSFTGTGIAAYSDNLTGRVELTVSRNIGTSPTVLLTPTDTTTSSRSLSYGTSDEIITVYAFDKDSVPVNTSFSIAVYASVE